MVLVSSLMGYEWRALSEFDVGLYSKGNPAMCSLKYTVFDSTNTAN